MNKVVEGLRVRDGPGRPWVAVVVVVADVAVPAGVPGAPSRPSPALGSTAEKMSSDGLLRGRQRMTNWITPRLRTWEPR